MHKKTKNLPLPAGKGVGGMGAKRKGKAGTTGDKEGKPPRGAANTHRAGDGWGKPPAGTGSPAANVKFTKKLDIFRAVWYS